MIDPAPHGTLIGIAWKAKPRAPMVTSDHAPISVEYGVAGDFRGASRSRQVTVLFEDDWRAACDVLGETRDWTVRRANLFVRGLENPRAAGGRLALGDVVLAITGETEPCSRMDSQWPGLRAALSRDWRGGLTASVVQCGALRVGCVVRWTF